MGEASGDMERLEPQHVELVESQQVPQWDDDVREAESSDFELPSDLEGPADRQWLGNFFCISETLWPGGSWTQRTGIRQ